MEDADGIAQWNASGSRKKIIVAAGLRAGQLAAGTGGGGGAESKVRTRTGVGKESEWSLSGLCIPFGHIFDYGYIHL